MPALPNLAVAVDELHEMKIRRFLKQASKTSIASACGREDEPRIKFDNLYAPLARVLYRSVARARIDINYARRLRQRMKASLQSFSFIPTDCDRAKL
jgi:hypothetical protein